MKNLNLDMRHYTFLSTVAIRHHAESKLRYASLYVFIKSDYTSPCEIRFQLYVTIHFSERCPCIIMQNLKLDVRHYTVSLTKVIRYLAESDFCHMSIRVEQNRNT